MENSSDRGALSDGVRVSEESKVFVRESNTNNVTRRSGWEAVESGSLGINDKQDGSKSRVVDMMSRDNEWGSWGVMNLVGRVLNGKFSMDKEVEDVKKSENCPEVNPVRDTTTWQGVIGQQTYSNGVNVKGSDIDKDSDKLNLGFRGEGNGLNGSEDLVSSDIVPDGQLKTEELKDVRADVLVSEGNSGFRGEGNGLNGNQDLASKEIVPDGKLKKKELNDVRADVLIPEGNSGCLGEGNALNGNQDLVPNEIVPDGKLETEEVNDVRADVLLPEGDSGCHGERNGLNGIEDFDSNEIVQDGKLKTGEVNVIKADMSIAEENLGCQGEENGLNGNHDLVPNEMVPDGKLKAEEVNSFKADVSIPEGNLGYRGKENDLNGNQNLVLDEKLITEEVNDAVMSTSKGDEELIIIQKEGEEYYSSNLVWGKVRSHPWWPGQMFDPSAASDKATKYFKKDSHLIAYFGDQTFAWNEGSKIKPFHMHFSQMEKQSNTDGFCHAVDCAIDEVARRVELGLSCPCLPQEEHDNIKFQVVENAGIREESSKRAGVDNLSSAASFLPGELVQFIGSLAESPKSKTDRLQFAMKKAQLLSFNRWRGHNQLPILEEFNVLLGNDGQFAVPGQVSEGACDFPSKKRKSTVLEGSSWKRKRPTDDEEYPNIKEKYLSNLQNDEKKPKKRGRKPKNCKPVNSAPSKESQIGELVPDVILSKLILTAKKPMQGHEIMIPEIFFLRELRNSTCVENSSSGDVKLDDGNHMQLDGTDKFGFGGTEDSYWTDRIIQTYSQDQVLFQPSTLKEGPTALEANKKERDAVMVDLHTDEKNPSVVMNEVSEEHCPTALILNFTNLESIPSATNLNEIFSRYGPLNESDTQIFSRSKRAKVIFKKKADAETAFSSTGKYSIFGPSLVSYRLNYEPTSRKSRPASKRSRKDTSLKVGGV